MGKFKSSVKKCFEKAGGAIAHIGRRNLIIICAVLIIGAVTFGTCLLGVLLGRKVGMKFAGKANIFGGIILIAIGIEIFLTGILG